MKEKAVAGLLLLIFILSSPAFVSSPGLAQSSESSVEPERKADVIVEKEEVKTGTRVEEREVTETYTVKEPVYDTRMRTERVKECSQRGYVCETRTRRECSTYTCRKRTCSSRRKCSPNYAYVCTPKYIGPFYVGRDCGYQYVGTTCRTVHSCNYVTTTCRSCTRERYRHCYWDTSRVCEWKRKTYTERVLVGYEDVTKTRTVTKKVGVPYEYTETVVEVGERVTTPEAA